MGELGKIIERKDVVLEIKAEIIHSLKTPITMYECNSWIVKKADRKEKPGSFGSWCQRGALQMPWTNRNRNQWVLEQMKPETPLEAKMRIVKLFYFG